MGGPAPALEHGRWRGRAFGLSIDADEPIPGVAPERGPRSARRVSWRRVGVDELAERWRGASTRSLVDLRRPGGEVFLRVDHDAENGYRVEAPGYGSHAVSNDGTSVLSSLPADAGRTWQRLFFAQVLPLAAAVSGLELLHASAVELEGAAYAFVAPSGTGKTSLAVHLVGAGGRFVTDDVLAVEARERSVLAYAGAATVSVDPAELARLPAGGRRRVAGEAWGSDDGKLQVYTSPGRPRPLRLDSVFYLRRGRAGTELTVRREPALGAPRILGAAFLPYLRSPARLATHLAVGAAISRSVTAYAVSIPSGMRADEAARLLWERGVEEGAWGC